MVFHGHRFFVERSWLVRVKCRQGKKSQLGTCPFKTGVCALQPCGGLALSHWSQSFIAMGGGAPLGVRNNSLLEFCAIVALPKCRTHLRARVQLEIFLNICGSEPVTLAPKDVDFVPSRIHRATGVVNGYIRSVSWPGVPILPGVVDRDDRARARGRVYYLEVILRPAARIIINIPTRRRGPMVDLLTDRDRLLESSAARAALSRLDCAPRRAPSPTRASLAAPVRHSIACF